jgi:hypothetical protein
MYTAALSFRQVAFDTCGNGLFNSASTGTMQ